MQNQRLYILKGEVKNPSWELRNHGVLIPRKVDGKDVGLREIQFVPGANSIWKEDNKDQGKAQSIWFSDGSHSVSEHDKVQIEFMENHPDYDKKYELYDPEAKAEAEYEKLELIEQAKNLLRENVDDEDKMAATAASLFGQSSMSWGAKQVKLRCFSFADQEPKKVIAALNDPAAEAKYIAALGMRKQIVMANPQKTAVIWNDKEQGVICPVPAGQKPLDVLGNFLFSEDNLVTLQEIGDRIDAIDGKKSKKKSTKKKD